MATKKWIQIETASQSKLPQENAIHGASLLTYDTIRRNNVVSVETIWKLARWQRRDFYSLVYCGVKKRGWKSTFVWVCVLCRKKKTEVPTRSWKDDKSFLTITR